MNKLTSVLLVDDHVLVLKMLVDRLACEPDIEVVGTVEDARSAVTEAIRLRPDVILMDIDMPGTSCFDAARTIHCQYPMTNLIFLSAFVNDRYVEQALEIEATGYLTKIEPPESVVAAIRAVANGKCYFSPQVQSRIVIGSKCVQLAQPKQSRTSTLSSREEEVLCYVAQGLSKKEIAKVMHISVKTVNNHTSHLMEKLQIHDRVKLARFAIREGLVKP